MIEYIVNYLLSLLLSQQHLSSGGRLLGLGQLRLQLGHAYLLIVASLGGDDHLDELVNLLVIHHGLLLDLLLEDFLVHESVSVLLSDLLRQEEVVHTLLVVGSQQVYNGFDIGDGSESLCLL